MVFRKANERTRVSFLRGVWESLGGETFEGRMEGFLMTLETGGSSGPHGMAHTGHEFVFCLRGQLEYEVEGQRYLLEAGDSLIDRICGTIIITVQPEWIFVLFY